MGAHLHFIHEYIKQKEAILAYFVIINTHSHIRPVIWVFKLLSCKEKLDFII